MDVAIVADRLRTMDSKLGRVTVHKSIFHSSHLQIYPCSYFSFGTAVTGKALPNNVVL